MTLHGVAADTNYFDIELVKHLECIAEAAGLIGTADEKSLG